VIRKWIFRAAIVVVLLTALAAVAAYFYPEKILCVDSGNVSADVIVVLGGGLGSHERPQRAAELFKEHAAPHIIVSGGGDDEINRRLLLQAGVPAAAIQVEGKSKTTRENAEFTIKLLREQKLRRVIIVTSWYHSRRALACFGHYAPEIKFYSRPAYAGFKRADRKEKGMSRHIYLEYAKLPGYWVCYGVWPF
jgi:uncharacterized SAM-binding protein YcdF (DUF218 family)